MNKQPKSKWKFLGEGHAAVVTALLFAGAFIYGVQAAPERPVIVAQPDAVYSAFAGDTGAIVQVTRGTFQVDTQRPVTFHGEWGALTIPEGEVLVEVGPSTLAVTVIRGTASVDSELGEPGLELLHEGESRVWAESDPVLTSLGMSE